MEIFQDLMLVEAIFANGIAQWLSQYLLPPEDIVDQVIDREIALLEAA